MHKNQAQHSGQNSNGATTVFMLILPNIRKGELASYSDVQFIAIQTIFLRLGIFDKEISFRSPW